MPNIVNIKDIPKISSRATYRKFFIQALKVSHDKGVEIPVAANKQTWSIYQSAYRALHRENFHGKLKVITREGRVFVVHKDAM